MKFLPPRLSIIEGLQLFHELQPDFNSRPYKLSVNSKEKGPPTHARTHQYAHQDAGHTHIRPFTITYTRITRINNTFTFIYHPKTHTHHTTPSQIHTKAFTAHADTLKYTMPPIVHVWWQMLLCSLFTDTSNPAICSAQLQDGLTALSSTVIITLRALEESEDAAFLDENHVQLQLNEWRRDIYYWTNQACWSLFEITYCAVCKFKLHKELLLDILH